MKKKASGGVLGPKTRRLKIIFAVRMWHTGLFVHMAKQWTLHAQAYDPYLRQCR